jgi:hypothetical protein
MGKLLMWILSSKGACECHTDILQRQSHKLGHLVRLSIILISKQLSADLLFQLRSESELSSDLYYRLFLKAKNGGSKG